ncbi:MAG: LuxR family transcriptional regulator [Actinobacteria bacterium]|nr:MAG: LuxR family transcriptional regulator [Actinomycetota bacterium]
MKGMILSAWPLVGRVDELEVIVAAIDDRNVGGVVLAGGAGVGKTRLAMEAARLATERGFRSATVLATRSSTGIPLGALAPLLPPIEDQVELRGDLLEWAARSLRDDEDQALALVVDDAQFLDDATATVIHQLAGSKGVFIIATVRTGGLVPAAARSLWKDGLARRIDLRPLSRAVVGQLLEEALGGHIDGGTRQQLWCASQGNPLFLRELLAGAIDAGVLRQVDGVWRLSDKLASTPRLQELVEARLADLLPTERDALELLAVGEPVPLAVLTNLVDPETIEALERHQLAHVALNGRRSEVRLDHPIHGDVLRESLTGLRALNLNRRLADATEATGAGRCEDLFRVALWRLEGGGAADAAAMVEAARTAFFTHDLTLAERLAGVAFQIEPSVRAGLVLTQVLGDLGRHRERDTIAKQLAQITASEEERALVAMEHALALFMGLDRANDALATLCATETQLQRGPWRDEVRAHRATFEMLCGRFPAALELALPVFNRPEDDRATAGAAVAAAPALAVMGRYDEALSVAERGLEVHLRLGEQEVMSHAGIHVVSRVLAHCESGRLEESAETARMGYDFAVATDTKLGQAWFALLIGRLALVEGKLDAAKRSFTEGGLAFADLGQRGLRRWCAAGQILATALQGDRSAAMAALADLDELSPSPMGMMEPDVWRARAWAAHVQGDPDEARRMLERAIDTAEVVGAWSLAAAAWHDLLRLTLDDGAAQGLRRTATRLDGPLGSARLALAVAVSDEDWLELDAASVDFEAMGALLYAAETAAAASAMAIRAGEPRAATAFCQRSRALLSCCEGAQTPMLDMAGVPPDLTRRERQVASLAARGLASKIIARRLSLSTRTVDNHLQRTYEKLGISSREDLASVLDPDRRLAVPD